MDIVLAENWWIYGLGALGYFSYVASSYLKTRNQVLLCEAAGCATVALQWALLDQLVPAGMNIAVSMTCLLGILTPYSRTAKQLCLLAFPFCVMVLLVFGGGSVMSIIAFAAVMPSLAARRCKNLLMLRSLAMTGGLMWLVVNLSFGVYAGALCNTGYILGHLIFITRHVLKGQAIKTLSTA